MPANSHEIAMYILQNGNWQFWGKALDVADAENECGNLRDMGYTSKYIEYNGFGDKATAVEHRF